MRAEEVAPSQGNRDADTTSFPGFCPGPPPTSPWAAHQGGSPFAVARSTTEQRSHLMHLPSAPLTFSLDPSRTFAPSIASTLGGSSDSLSRQPSLPPITAEWLAAALTATLSPKRRPTPGGSPEPQYDVSHHSTSSSLATAGAASLLEVSPDVGAAGAGGIEDVLGMLAAGGGGGGGGFGGGAPVPPGCRLRRVRRVTSDLNCLVECPSVSCR